jgi:glycosyltransferase involved in cell wall biosynthesis
MPSAPISVVIPAHNAEAFLEEAIRSVHAQTLEPAEIIVIADDCTDRTPEIAAKLGAIVLEQKRRNMAAGLNLGVKASSQPWIALLDADDLWHKRKLALQWKAIKDCPAAALVSCDLSILVGNKVTPILSLRQARDRWKGLEYVTVHDHCYYLEKIPGDFLPRFNMGTPTVMLRRDVFARVGFFDETLTFLQALELFARVMAAYPMAYVERSLVYHRRHDRNHTRNPVAFWPMYISIINRMLKAPDSYPEGAGRAYRERFKEQFVHFERAFAQGNFKIDGQANTES